MTIKRTTPLGPRQIPLLVLLLLPCLALPAFAAFDATAATDAYLATIPADVRARTNEFVNGNYLLDLVDVIYALIVSWLLLGTGVSQRMRNIAERISRWRWLSTFIYGAQYAALTALATLPFAYYRGFVREHEYGLSNHTLASWATDTLTSTVVGILAMALLVAVIYAVIRRAPKSWWLWGTGTVTIFAALAIAVAPVFIEPLFNTYTPMEAGPLKDDIIAIAHANGVPADDVMVVDASRQTTRISANVSGLFGTTRIALNDNLLNKTSPAEIKAVMAHEIGHYALNHVFESLAYFALLFLVVFALAKAAYTRVVAKWGARWGLREESDVAGLPALAAIMTVLFYLATPAFATIIRTNEAEADIFSLNAAHEPDGFAQAILKLATYRKAEPAAWEEAIFFDHPSARSRVRMAMEWKAAQEQRSVAPPPP